MSDIIKAGAVVKFPGNLPYRVVLRAMPNYTDENTVREYVVHYEAFEGGKSSFANGSYFPVRAYDGVDGALKAALKVFDRRCKDTYSGATGEHYHHPDAIKVVLALRDAEAKATVDELMKLPG